MSSVQWRMAIPPTIKIVGILAIRFMIIELIYAYILGILSILSPCTFIVVPVIVSDPKIRRILCFLAGITITYGVLGILSALTGKLLTNFLGPYLYLFAGAVTLLAGIEMIGIFNLHTLRLNFKTKNNFFMGILFGSLSLCCIGPLLSAILVFITIKANLLIGFIMMLTFSLGFVTPFIIFGFLVSDKRVYKIIEKHTLIIRKIGGILLLIVSAYLFFVAFRGII